MYLQLKSILKNRFTIFMTFLSIFVSIFIVYLANSGSKYSEKIFLKDNQAMYLDWSKALENEKTLRKNPDSEDQKYLDFLEFTANAFKIEYENIIDKSKYSDKFIENFRNVNSLANLNESANPRLNQKLARELYQDKIDKYIDLNIDIDSFGYIRIKEGNYIQEFSEPLYQYMKMSLDRTFYLLENDMKDIGFHSKSPWSYLSYSYNDNAFKSNLFSPLIVLFSTFIVINARREKSFDLSLAQNKSKLKLYTNYVFLGIVASLFVFFISDLISVLYFGFRYGFDGLENPILVFKDTFNSFSTYENTGEQGTSKVFGIGSVYALPVNSIHPYYPQNLSYMTNRNFFIFSFFLEIIKLVLFSLLGTSIGINIKNKVGATLASLGLVVFIIVSKNSELLSSEWNVFSMNSGWNHALGWTHNSWLWAVLSGLTAIIVCFICSYNFYKNRDLI